MLLNKILISELWILKQRRQSIQTQWFEARYQQCAELSNDIYPVAPFTNMV